MESGRSDFGRKLPMSCRLYHLVDHCRVGPGKEAILLHGVIPDQLLDVVEGGLNGQLNLRHGRDQIEVAGQHLGTHFHELAIAVRRRCVVRGPGA